MAMFGGPEMTGKVNAAAAIGVAGSGIHAAGQRLIADMRRTTGSGDPDRGDVFGRAALQFGDAEATVAAAAPGDGWHGGAARAYADANRRQADRAASMAVLDRGVHAVIGREAEQIGVRRENLDSQAEHLAQLRRTTEAIGAVPGIGHALRATFALTAVNAALTSSTSELCQLTRDVDDNAAALQQIAQEYVAITSDAAAPTESEVKAAGQPVRLNPGDSPATPKPPQI